MKLYRSFLLAAIGLFSVSAARAAGPYSLFPECVPPPEKPETPGLLDGVKAAHELLDEQSPREKKKGWMDLQLILDVQSNGSALKVTTVNEGLAGRANYSRVQDIFYASAGLDYFSSSNPFPLAGSYAQSVAMIRQNAKSLSKDDKLLLLSMWGAKLSAGYDHSVPGGITSFDQLFENARSGGSRGGVCRDIHSYIAELAEALGFKAVGTFSALSGVGNTGAAHQVTHFRDPETGEYYVQNYGTILNTHQKVLFGAIDIGTRALGPVTTASYVESLKGRTHLYVPKTSRWIMQKVDSITDFKDQPILTIRAGVREQTFGIQRTTKVGNGQLKGFFLHSDYTARDGTYQIDLIGVGGKLEKKKELQNALLDEVGVLAEGHLGYLRLEDQEFLHPERTQHRDNIATKLTLAGHARINSVTGKLELTGQTIDFNPHMTDGYVNTSGVANAINASLAYEPKDSALKKVELSRSAFIGPASMRGTDVSVVTSHDKLNIIIDNRKQERKVYIESDSKLFALDGIERFSALGLQEVLKTSIPTARHGEVAVILDISRVMANQIIKNGEKDPFYEVPLRTSVKAQWKKALTRAIEIGVDASYTRGGGAFYIFEAPGGATPDLTVKKKNDVSGNAWLRFKY